MTLPDNIDIECRELCMAINAIDGLATVSSCCGHNTESYKVWFVASHVHALLPLLYWSDSCHSGIGGWRVTATTDCSMDHVTFCLESTWAKGPKAYAEATEIARLILSAIEQLKQEGG